jgi:hypothetical protein
MSSYTITNTPGSTSTLEDYSVEDAARDARKLTRIFVVVEDATGEDITDVMTYAEASKFITDMADNPRPNAVKGWMHIEEREVEVFTEEQEALFNELREALDTENAQRMSLGFRGTGTPLWRVDQMLEALENCKARTDEIMSGMCMEDAKAFGRWRKLHK